jgi:hypothetical protein
MTVFAGPQDSANMSQAQWEEVEAKLWTDGVIAFARNTFTTTTTSGLGISVNTGDAIVDGFRFYSDAATPLTAAAADPSLPRIDLLVLRIDESAHTATIALKTGTPAGSPTPPAATKTPGGTYELGVYNVRVNAASSTITSLTDVRTYTQPNLNGLSIGNLTGNIPVSNGVKNVNLNADSLDGKDVSNNSGDIPFNNGTVNTNLNADMVDGVHAASFAQLASAANFTSSLQKSGKDVLFAQAGLTGKFSAQSTAPSSPADGDLWLDTSTVL